MDITLLPIWSDEKSISFFPKSHKPSLIPRKMPEKMQIEGHSTQFLATNPIIVKVRGNKATLGTCPSLEEPKESSQLEFQ